jgi:hypothetical protein
MDTSKILIQLRSERERIDKAIQALESLDKTSSRHSNAPTGRKRRRLSAEARRRISQAQKKRWAAQKKQG